MSAALEILHHRGRLNWPLLVLFLLITSILLFNAILHDPTAGYDAQDHLHYVRSLAANWQLPTKTDTGQYYSPPLPYVFPAALTALHMGLWKALKLAQLMNVLLAIGLMYYLLKTCELVSPDDQRFKLLSLGFLGVLPVFYRSFSLVRGEPYLAFLSVLLAYETLAMVLKRDGWLRRSVITALALGLSLLARQWGSFLFPPVIIFGMWHRESKINDSPVRLRPVLPVLSVLLPALLIGGWFYALIFQRYGTLTEFDRAAQPVSASKLSELTTLEASSVKVFSDPVRPSLSGRAFPILYADTWGDYWGYFLVYARNPKGSFQDGIFFQKNTCPSLPPGFSSNRCEINRYLGALNVLALLPSAFLLGGLLYGGHHTYRFLRRQLLSDRERALAFLAMSAGSSLLGFLWFVMRYQSPTQAGDLVKATYILQAFPALAFLAAGFVERASKARPAFWRAAVAILASLFITGIPAYLTHYVHIAMIPGQPGLLLSTFVFLLGLVITYWVHTRYYLDIVVEPVAAPHDGPPISVCVPARNEAANIRRCVEAVLTQTYPNFELIVLDDGSTDATPGILDELAGDPRLRVLHGAELPPGWAGKPHALMQAAGRARGEWLCFIDADTFLTKDALASCFIKAIETRADLFTIMTRQIMGTFWEKVVMPLVVTALSVGFPPRQVNDPKVRSAVANGQFIMIRRSLYAALGGHERVKGAIVEDKALAELVKGSGYRLVLADGRLVASTRMYTSLPQMWEGWTKNIFLGLSDQPNLIFLGALGGLLLVVAALFMPVWPLLGLYWYLNGGGWMAVAVILMALTMWAVLLYVRARVARGMGMSPWYALTLPLGAGIFAAMMFSSSWKVLSGAGVTWRGRRYDPRRL